MLHWTDDLAVGHPTIDNDHKKLIEIINTFLDQSHSADNATLMNNTLKSLLNYGVGHFEREEQIQRETNYPYTAMHNREHKVLIAQIKDMANVYFIEKSRPLNTASIHELNNLLKIWLIDHIKKCDLNMREWVDPNAEDVKD